MPDEYPFLPCEVCRHLISWVESVSCLHQPARHASHSTQFECNTNLYNHNPNPNDLFL